MRDEVFSAQERAELEELKTYFERDAPNGCARLVLQARALLVIAEERPNKFRSSIAKAKRLREQIDELVAEERMKSVEPFSTNLEKRIIDGAWFVRSGPDGEWRRAREATTEEIAAETTKENKTS